MLYRCEWSHIIGIYCSFLSEYTHVVLKSRVNYCSHSSRGAAKGQLRIPGWFWQSGTLETGAHERQSAGIAEAETHGRFSPPAYRGVPNLSPNPRHGARARSWQRRHRSPNSETTSPLVIFRFFLQLLRRGFHIIVGAENDVSQRSGFSWDGGTRRREETTWNWRGMTVSFRRGEPRWRGTAVCWWPQQSWLQLLDPGGESEWNTANDSREPRQAPWAAAPPLPPLSSQLHTDSSSTVSACVSTTANNAL